MYVCIYVSSFACITFLMVFVVKENMDENGRARAFSTYMVGGELFL
jgi:hypothetical protein